MPTFCYVHTKGRTVFPVATDKVALSKIIQNTQFLTKNRDRQHGN